MRSIEDKGVLNVAPMPENSSTNSNKFEFVHKGNGPPNRAFGKPAPSKWDDAQKWLVNLSRGGPESKSEKPRDSNADDRRLIAPVPKTEDYSSGGEDMNGTPYFDGETKNVDIEEVPVWRINKRINNPQSVVRSICVRDMGTEMTPIASQEPSRNATPIRVMSPNRSPSSSSGSSTPVRTMETVVEGSQGNVAAAEGRGGGGGGGGGFDEFRGGQKMNAEQVVEKTSSALEIRAAAWDEAERAKYMARYKREEVKIQAWENHEKRKAEMEMRRMEVKAERLKTRAQERLANKLAATRRIAEEKLANAEAQLNEQAVRTSERADYIRRTGHLPSSFSFKLPSCCW